MQGIDKIILGTAQFGLDYGINNNSGKISFEDSCTILKAAFENGIKFLDTAEAYGNAHNVIGDFHQLNPGIRFNIITKIPHGKQDNIQERVQTYLEDLKVSSIEVLMFHSFDSYKENANTLGFLMELKSIGAIKHIGVSVYTNEQIDALLFDDRISVVQMPFNLLDNETFRGSALNKLKEKRKIIHTRSAFLQGLFFKNASENNELYEKLVVEIEEIKEIAKEEGTTINNLALSYCLSQSHIDNVLIGVDSIVQLEENIKGLDFKISQKAIREIDLIKVKDINLLNPSLWKQKQ